MTRCSDCGAFFEESERKCPRCGATLEEILVEMLAPSEVRRQLWAELAEDGKEVLLNWKEFPGDESYVIYHSMDSKNFEKLAERPGWLPKFIHKDLPPGKHHYYIIAGLDRQGKERQASGVVHIFLEESES